jgi:hypothetical protein
MQLVVSICYPDGTPPDCRERILYYDDDNAAELFDGQWSKRSPIYLFVEEGIVACHFVGFEFCEGDPGDQIEGEYAMVIVKENDFIPIPSKARFH